MKNFLKEFALAFLYMFSWQHCCVFATEVDEREIVEKQVQTYFEGISCISSNFIQFSSGETTEGSFLLFKSNEATEQSKNPLSKQKDLIKIEYKQGVIKEIVISDGVIRIVYRDHHKTQSYSASQIPLYAILTKKLALNSMAYSIVENTPAVLKIRIAGKMPVLIVFSRYPKTSQIKNLEGWEILEGEQSAKPKTIFLFVPESFHVNDLNVRKN